MFEKTVKVDRVDLKISKIKFLIMVPKYVNKNFRKILFENKSRKIFLPKVRFFLFLINNQIFVDPSGLTMGSAFRRKK